ncbi:MAG: hypothetical protein AAF492_26840, partial [Verrucomicrobiota bacterium]
RPGPYMVKAFSSDMEDWHDVVQGVSKVFDEHGSVIFNDTKMNKEWDNVVGTLANSLGKHIASQDPINLRQERLNEAEYFLRTEQSANVLGERGVKLLQDIGSQRDTFVIRIVNQTGDGLRIKVDGVPNPLQVPLNKVKRFMLRVGPQDRETTFHFSGMTWLDKMSRKIHLVRGGGQDLTLNNLNSSEGAVPLTVMLEDVEQGSPPIGIEYQGAGDTAMKQIEDRVQVDVQPGEYAFRFTRLDYEPIDKQVSVPAGSTDYLVPGPHPNKWVPKPALKKLLTVETAWQKVDKATLERELDKKSADGFEWKGHKIRMDQARERWLREVRTKGRTSSTGASRASTPKSVEVTSTPRPKAPPAKVADGMMRVKFDAPRFPSSDNFQMTFRELGGSAWSPLAEGDVIAPGLYEVKFMRSNYQT